MHARSIILGQLCLLAVSTALAHQLPLLDAELERATGDESPARTAHGYAHLRQDLQNLAYGHGGTGHDYDDDDDDDDDNEFEPAVVLLVDVRRQGARARRKPKIVFQGNIRSEDALPECRDKLEVCNRVDVYGEPWIEKRCRCSNHQTCSTSLSPDDGYTIADKTRQYKLCQPVKHLPICRYIKDTTWTIETLAGRLNETVMKAQCRCRPGSVSYFAKSQAAGVTLNGKKRFLYHFSCSPESRLKCMPEEPCRMFSKSTRRSQVEDVTVTSFCQCDPGQRCPRRHTDPGSRLTYHEREVKVYAGHCTPLPPRRQPAYAVFP